MPIRILPDEIASQIAAGEVIERPASVVKELLENSIDAEASQISVLIEGGGQRVVEVADNGTGINPEEISLAVSRHATSKLSSVQDLINIATLGFRGEALASIASVSRLTLSTKQNDSAAGIKIIVEGGKNIRTEQVGIPSGTTVRVEDLFYNVPARKKFLKREITERKYIDSLVARYAMAYPFIRFKLVQEGKPAIQTSGNGDRKEVLSGLYGVEIARQMIEVNFQEENIRIKGYISPTQLSRSNRQEIHFFVNGRPVQDSALTSAVIKAYQTYLMVGRYPITILLIELSPMMVDVNVHPTKAEVRFSDASWIFSNVQRVVRRTLIAHSPVPEISLMGGIFHQPGEPAVGANRAPNLTRSYWEERPLGSSTSQPGEISDTSDEEVTKIPLLRIIGQIAATYLVAEGPDGLYLIDQHAAHERVLFEKMSAVDHPNRASQSLLQPVVVELTASQARLLNEQLPFLSNMGFQVEPFGPNAFLVRAIPQVLGDFNPSMALRSLVEDFEEDETPLQGMLEKRLIARICKRAAIKAGQTLSIEEQKALLFDLEGCNTPRTCPHGRPTMIHISVDLLERQFGRKGV